MSVTIYIIYHMYHIYISIYHVYIYISIYIYIVYIYTQYIHTSYIYTYMHRTNSISDTHFLWVGTFVRSFVLGSHTLKPCEISCIPGHTSTWGMFLSLSLSEQTYLYIVYNIYIHTYIHIFYKDYTYNILYILCLL